MVEADQFKRVKARDLAAKFGADGASRPSHHDDLPTNPLADERMIELRRFSPQQVFQVHFPGCSARLLFVHLCFQTSLDVRQTWLVGSTGNRKELRPDFRFKNSASMSKLHW